MQSQASMTQGHVPHQQGGDHRTTVSREDVYLLQHAQQMDPSADQFSMSAMGRAQMQNQMQQSHLQQGQMQHGPMSHQHQMSAQHQQYHPHVWNGMNMPHPYAPVIEGDTGVKAAGGKSSKKRSNANNDGEMKELFQSNRGRPLEDVAKSLRSNERGPNAERTRQLYAMLW